MRLNQTIVAPAVYPITACDLNNHLGQYWEDAARDRQYETAIIPAALRTAEAMLDGSIRYSTWSYIRTDWPSGCEPIELPMPPHDCVEKFHYRDACGTWLAVADEFFRIEKQDTGWKLFACDQWPGQGCGTGPVCDPCCTSPCKNCPTEIKIQFKAGYKCMEDMPGNIRLGILKLCEFYIDSDFEFREMAESLLDQDANLRLHGHYG